MTNIECPVCKSIISGNVCEKCGYVPIVFPEIIPDNVARFEKERVEKLKQIFERNNAEVIQAQQGKSQAQQQVKTLTQELNKLSSEKEALDRDRNMLKSKTANQSSEIVNLKSTVEKCQADAYLIFIDGDDFSVFPIRSDKSAFFANGPGKKVKFGNIEGVEELPIISKVEIAFEIRPYEHGFRIVDYCNSVRKNGNLIKGTEKIMNKDSLSFSESLSFKASFTLLSRKNH